MNNYADNSNPFLDDEEDFNEFMKAGTANTQSTNNGSETVEYVERLETTEEFNARLQRETGVKTFRAPRAGELKTIRVPKTSAKPAQSATPAQSAPAKAAPVTQSVAPAVKPAQPAVSAPVAQAQPVAPVAKPAETVVEAPAKKKVVSKKGTVTHATTPELAEKYGITNMTVRRRIRAAVESGIQIRVVLDGRSWLVLREDLPKLEEFMWRSPFDL